MFFDINGDMKTDILYTTVDRKNVVLLGQDYLGLKFESKDFSSFLVPEADDPRCV